MDEEEGEEGESRVNQALEQMMFDAQGAEPDIALIQMKVQEILNIL